MKRVEAYFTTPELGNVISGLVKCGVPFKDGKLLRGVLMTLPSNGGLRVIWEDRGVMVEVRNLKRFSYEPDMWDPVVDTLLLKQLHPTSKDRLGRLV